MKKILLTLAFLGISLVFLVFAIKGNKGTPLAYQATKDTRVSGPYEATNSTSRYALVEAIVEHHRFTFTDAEASFSSPDLVKYKEKYFSIFTPGVSFVSVPFYMVGKNFQMPQIFAYFPTLIFALLNMFLIQKLAKKLGAKSLTAWISAFIFLFATNAFVYALTLTQHHFSVTLILIGLLLITYQNSFWRNFGLGMVYALGVLVDIPNAFMLLPIIFFAVAQHFNFKDETKKTVMSLNLSVVGIALGMIPFAIVFLLYNYSVTGSYTKIGQFIGQYNYPAPNSIQQAIPDIVPDQKDVPKPTNISLPFKTRLQLQDFYILFVSKERAWWYYSPVIIVGLIGLIQLSIDEKNRAFSLVAFSVVLVDITLYTMFGDPWGGWAFGPRYLLPAAGILAVYIAPTLQRYAKNILFSLVFIPVTIYSICISTIGALTTAAIPPYGEAEHQGFRVDFTYKYNWTLLTKENLSSSLLYNLFLSGKVTAVDYAIAFASVLSVFFFIIYLISFVQLPSFKRRKV